MEVEQKEKHDVKVEQKKRNLEIIAKIFCHFAF